MTPWLPEGVDENGALVSTQREVTLGDDCGAHSHHILALVEDLGDDQWRAVCSCGEPCTITIDSTSPPDRTKQSSRCSEWNEPT